MPKYSLMNKKTYVTIYSEIKKSTVYQRVTVRKEEIFIKIKLDIQKRGKVVFIIIILSLIICYGFYTGLVTTSYTYRNEKIPEEFDGFRIAFISDFHCKKVGSHEDKLIESIEACNPNIVVFTGDMIDDNHMNLTPVEDLLSGLAGKYPMYAVSGNHEKDNIKNYEKLLEYYQTYNVNYLDGNGQVITINGASIGIYGKAYTGYYYNLDFLKGPDMNQTNFNILLYHDATAYPSISDIGFDLILSGHTHGGIIRLPLIGGLINNKGSLIAEYEKGIYESSGSTMISNRGIGDAVLPRFYNRSEVVCVSLKAD